MAYQYGFSPFNIRNNQDNYARNQFTRARGAGYSVTGTTKKHSGCKSGVDKKGRRYVSGWKYTKRAGLVSFFAAPYKGTKQRRSKNDILWENWIVKFRSNTTMVEDITTCLYNVQSGKVVIQKMGFVMNPKGGKGGYVGTFKNK